MEMRRGLVAMAIASGSAIAIALAAACGGSTAGETRPDDTIEAGASFDATSTVNDARADAATDSAVADAAPNVSVIMLDETNAPVQDASVTFGSVTLATNAQGVASYSMPDGGSVSFVDPLGPAGPGGISVQSMTITGAQNGDVIHVGPTRNTANATITGTVNLPNDANAASFSANFANCGGGGALDASAPPIALDVALTGGNADYSPRCIDVNGHIGATFLASDDTGAPTDIALKDVDPKSPVSLASTDWQSVSTGTMTFSGTPVTLIGSQNVNITSRIDFPFGFTRYPGSARTTSTSTPITPGDFAFVAPPPSVAPALFASTVLESGYSGVANCSASSTTIHVRRVSTTTTVMEALDSFPAINGLDEFGGGGASNTCGDMTNCAQFNAPIPSSAIVLCNGTLSPIPAGTKYVSCFLPTVVMSPQLTYEFARQHPTAIFDPYTLLSLLGSNAEVYVMTMTFQCLA
jgi:hypothetical protein